MIFSQKQPTKRVFRDDDDSDVSLQKKPKKVPQKQIKQAYSDNESDMEIDSDKENAEANQIPSPVATKAKKNTDSRLPQPANNSTKSKTAPTEKVQPSVESVKSSQPTSTKEKQAEKSKGQEKTNSDEQEKPKQTRSKSVKAIEREKLLAEVDQEIQQQHKRTDNLQKEKERAAAQKTTARVSLDADGEVEEKAADVKVQKAQKGRKTSESFADRAASPRHEEGYSQKVRLNSS